MKRTLYTILFLVLGISLQAQLASRDYNQFSFGVNRGGWGSGDIIGYSFSTQYEYVLKSKWVFGVGFKAIMGSRGDDIWGGGLDTYPTTLLGPGTDVGTGGNYYQPDFPLKVYDLHHNKTTGMGFNLSVGYQIRGNNNVLKLKAGGVLYYIDQSFVVGVNTGSLPQLFLEDVTFVSSNYNRYLDFGWHANVAYEYHFSDIIFVGAQIDLMYLNDGESFGGIGFYFGVKLPGGK